MLKYFAFLEILIHTVITALLDNLTKGNLLSNPSDTDLGDGGKD